MVNFNPSFHMVKPDENQPAKPGQNVPGGNGNNPPVKNIFNNPGSPQRPGGTQNPPGGDKNPPGKNIFNPDSSQRPGGPQRPGDPQNPPGPGRPGTSSSKPNSVFSSTSTSSSSSSSRTTRSSGSSSSTSSSGVHFAQRDDIHGNNVKTSTMDTGDKSIQNLFTQIKNSLTSTTNANGVTTTNSNSSSAISKFNSLVSGLSVSYSTKSEATAEAADQKVDDLLAKAKAEAMKELSSSSSSSTSSTSSSSSSSNSSSSLSNIGSMVTSALGNSDVQSAISSLFSKSSNKTNQKAANPTTPASPQSPANSNGKDANPVKANQNPGGDLSGLADANVSSASSVDMASLQSLVQSATPENLSDIQAQLNEASSTINNELSQANDQQASLEAQKETAESNVETLQDSVHDSKEMVDSLEGDLGESKTTLDSSIEARDAKDQELADENADYDEACEDVKEKESAKSDAQTAVSTAKENTATAEANVESANQEVDSLQDAVDNADDSGDDEEVNAQNEANEKALSEAKQKQTQAQQELKKAQDAEQKAQDALTQAESDLTQAQQYKEGLLTTIAEDEPELRELAEQCKTNQKTVETNQQNYDTQLKAFDDENANYTKLNTELESQQGILTQYDANSAKIGELQNQQQQIASLQNQLDAKGTEGTPDGDAAVKGDDVKAKPAGGDDIIDGGTLPEVVVKGDASKYKKPSLVNTEIKVPEKINLSTENKTQTTLTAAPQQKPVVTNHGPEYVQDADAKPAGGKDDGIVTVSYAGEDGKGAKTKVTKSTVEYLKSHGEDIYKILESGQDPEQVVQNMKEDEMMASANSAGDSVKDADGQSVKAKNGESAPANKKPPTERQNQIAQLNETLEQNFKKSMKAASSPIDKAKLNSKFVQYMTGNKINLLQLAEKEQNGTITSSEKKQLDKLQKEFTEFASQFSS